MSKNRSSRTTVREKSDASIIEKYKRNDLTGTTFPIKLHIALKVLHNEESEDIVSWMPHGRSFKVHSMRVFEEIIMKRFFRQSKISSFRRQLNLYGFQRVHYGRDIGSYYHRYFLRGKPQLAKHITRESCTRMQQMYNHQRLQHQEASATGTDEPYKQQQQQQQGMAGGASTFDVNRSQDFYDMPYMGSVNDIAMVDAGISSSRGIPFLRSSNEGGIEGQATVSNLLNNGTSMVRQSVRTSDLLMNHHNASHQGALHSSFRSPQVQHEHALSNLPVQEQQLQEQVQLQEQDTMSMSTSALRAGYFPTRSLTALSNNTSNTPIIAPTRTGERDQLTSFSSLLPLLSAERMPALSVALLSSLSSLQQGAVSSSLESDQSIQQQQQQQQLQLLQLLVLRQQQLQQQRRQSMLHHIEELPRMISPQEVPNMMTNAHNGNQHQHEQRERNEGPSDNQSLCE
ncbi:hypothetical protein CTEN210_01653 [Chaetoceros tenuissimus]|uniref:HSF-type DNA-binding domain-containing protein n=1 Tax=Chaetoceros tenuissimus TaxID=426638 RepID=A0AAD3CI08_9STRA|nr:hypothetical protein CTEN210_01653 [Chaetoceros tenuissimus]